MAKLYIEDSKYLELLQPKTETVNFILNYSKALKVIKSNQLEFETFQN